VTTGLARLTLLNSFELVCDGAKVQLPMSVQRVIAFVALHDHPLLRPYVAGSLWLDTPEERAHANLRSALWRLHRSGDHVIEADGQLLRLDAAVVVDLTEAETLARRILHEDQGALDLAPEALAGDLLPDWYDDWVVIERERFRQLRLRSLDVLCERLTQAGRLGEALDAGLFALAGEPLRESAHRALVRVHLAEGNAADAIRQYRLCRQLLKDQLGIEPSEQMRQLMLEIDDRETVR
jgi:DNA-binding SARP family transcriptional activator